jgi:signal transduction histidine kinase
VILSGLQTLEELGTDLAEDERQRIVHHGITAGDRMMALISSLLDLARLESGQMPLRVQEVEVEKLVATSVEEMKPWAKQRQLGLTAQFCVDVESVWADPELTRRVLVNLLNNAIKFSPPESTITIRVADGQDGMLAFSVIDQGPGIPAEWQQRIFDKFVHIEARTIGVTVGSGLGLYFCQQALRAQGGQIWVESGQSEGSTIHFTLPAAVRCFGDQHPHEQPMGNRVPSDKLMVLSPERPHRYTRLGNRS